VSRHGERSDVPLDLMQVGRLVWTELPVLMLISLLATLAATVTMGVALAVAALAPLVAAVLLGPAWIGSTTVCVQLLAGDAAGARGLVLAIRKRWRTGTGLSMPPAIVAVILIGTASIRGSHEGQAWLLLPLGVDALALILLLLGGVMVFPLSVMTGLRGRDCWLAALALVGRNVVSTLGIAAFFVLLALSVRYLGPILLLIAAGPLALLCTAVTRGAIAEPTIEGTR
jgi:hypothetical protein